MMKHKIEPGMLCLIVGGYNSGKQCVTVRQIDPEESCLPELIGKSGLPCRAWIIKGDSLESRARWSGVLVHTYIGYSLAKDSQLLPIQPDNTITMTEKKTIKVPSAPECTV